ncbi:MAG: DNA topoisomerase III [Candidatus Cloacimonadales bacterium]
MKKLILAEKPSVGRDLARVLGCRQRGKGFLEGKDYVVTWALGHLVTLAEPKDYQQKWQHWDLEYLPMLPEKMKIKIIRKTSQQMQVIKKLCKREDLKELVIATDAGREGELVARWIIEKTSWKQRPIKRLWISSQTEKAILEGMQNLSPAEKYQPLFRAAVCRAVADWQIGLNVTRALTCKFEAQLNAGRVQTPTLAMIIQREEAINNFVPVNFQTIKLDFGDYFAEWIDSKNSTRIFEPGRAAKIAAEISGKTGIIKELESKSKSEKPPLAYDLTELQRDANRKFGFSAKQTLATLQGLYERHKIVTYPRTDSRYLTSDLVPTLPERLQRINFGPYKKLVQPLLKQQLQPGKRLINDAKVSDHHAIIPTEQTVNFAQLSSEEKRLYDLIVKRFIAVLYPDYQYQSLKLITAVGEQRFISRGRKVLQPGWRAVSNPLADETEQEVQVEQPLRNLSINDRFLLKKVQIKNGKTSPPARYTEATLLSVMENPTNFIEDSALKKSLRAGGLGTPATRADIIEKLLRANYIGREGKSLRPTAKAFELIRLVPAQLRSAELTARWEQKLDLIAKGQYEADKFERDIRQNALEMVHEIKSSRAKYVPPNLLQQKCPLCGAALQELGQKIICSDRHCDYQQNGAKKKSTSRRLSKKEYGRGKHLLSKYGKAEEKQQEETLGDLFDL